MNRKMTSAAIGASVLGGALVGASFVGSAGAYGGLEDEAPEGTDVETTTVDEDGGNVLTQDTDDADTPDADGAEDEGREGRRGNRGGCHLEEIAAAIGIEEDALRAELDAGQSIADVAEANGVDSSVIVDLLVDSAEERIAEKVEEGRITDEEAAEKLANVEERAEDRVERVRGEDADD
ncbi:MAG: hypothetical protein AAGE98_12615, partial [Actinomycetota bacterium]